MSIKIINPLLAINSAPVEIPTEEQMTDILASAAKVGGVYKYTGETTATYEKDGLYIIQAVK